MQKNRLEMFSDGVLAIIITIMVLELKVPVGTSLADLLPLVHVFLSYVLSFAFLGIYWNNHHHMLHTLHRVTGRILWANLHLLFWLSLIPFATGWMGEGHFASAPVALYGVVLFMAALAYSLLQYVIICEHGLNSMLAQAVGYDLKGKFSIAAYLAAIPLAYVSTLLSAGLFVIVAALWVVPDTRIERALVSRH